MLCRGGWAASSGAAQPPKPLNFAWFYLRGDAARKFSIILCSLEDERVCFPTMRYMPVLLLLITMPVLAATVWKWRDANGVVHYSDQPVPGAEQVSIQSSSTFSPAPLQGRPASSQTSSAAANVAYTNVEIWKPNAEETIANTVGLVGVGVRVEPQLAAGHHLALYMDGRLVPGFPAQGTEYELSEVERGAHTLVLAVIDAKGSQVITSSPVQFYIRQPSVLRAP
jgi:hypothetical protein